MYFTASEAARSINPALDGKTFKRYADRLGAPYHRIGRERYYTEAAIKMVLEGTRKCPEGETDLASDGGGGNTPLCGPKEDAPASVAQARQIAAKLKKSTRNGLPQDAKGHQENVIRLNTL